MLLGHFGPIPTAAWALTGQPLLAAVAGPAHRAHLLLNRRGPAWLASSSPSLPWPKQRRKGRGSAGDAPRRLRQSPAQARPPEEPGKRTAPIQRERTSGRAERRHAAEAEFGGDRGWGGGAPVRKWNGKGAGEARRSSLELPVGKKEGRGLGSSWFREGPDRPWRQGKMRRALRGKLRGRGGS
jgi:hypothetical protein